MGDDDKKQPKGYAASPTKKSPTKPASPPRQKDLFNIGFDFTYPPGAAETEPKARVWAHKDAPGAGKCPLLIYLHGDNIKKDDKGKVVPGLHQLAPPLYGPDDDKQGWMHAGKLLSPLIAKKEVVPLVVACPTVFERNRDGHLWLDSQFDLSTFVREVRKALKDAGSQVEIDLKCVAVTGHSGAGGSTGRGLNRIIEQKGSFSVDDGNTHETHDLTLLGVMDTRTDATFGSLIRMNLGPKKIDVYAVHRPQGGWGSEVKKQVQSHDGFCKGLGAHQVLTNPNLKFETVQNLLEGTPMCDSSSAPRRISIAVTQTDDSPWNAAAADWDKTAYRQYDGWEHHFDVTVIWTVWAARRYFAPQACDKRNVARAAALKRCEDCEALQAMIDANEVDVKLKFRSKDADAVAHLQFHLVEFGYPLPKLPTFDDGPAFPDGIDGDYGNGTVKALAAFLAEIHMSGDGKSVTPDMAKAILEKHKQGFRSSGAPAAKNK